MRAWIEELSAREPGGPGIARLILSDIQEQLVTFGTKLKGIIPDRTCDPPLYWWQYYEGHWISFVVRESGLWKWRTRRIIVYSVGERPPDRVVASSPRA
jgi:hypothetical protein